MDLSTQPLKIADRTFSSRLLLGTGKFASNDAMRDACVASGSELVTVALERVVVERNGEPLTPSEARESPLADGDRLEIVRIVAGG